MSEHGEMGLVSASVLEGAPVHAIRFGSGPDDGFSIIAREDAPCPDVENVRMACVHCLVALLDDEIAAGMELARRQADEFEDGIGVVIWCEGRWVDLDEAEAAGVIDEDGTPR